MGEVELVSELLIQIIAGISEGSKATIDRYYRQFDEEFPVGAEVARRFRHIMDVICDRITDVDRMPFEKKTLFYPFFAALYDCTFGFKSSLETAKAARLKKGDIESIAAAGRKLHEGKAPPSVQELTQRRVTQAGVRRKISQYLLKNTSANA